MTISTDEEQEQEQTSNIKHQTSININAARFGTSQIIHIPYIMPIWRTQHRPRTRQKYHHSNSPTAPPRPISGDKGHPLPLWRFFSVAIGSSKQSVYKQFVFPEIVFHKTVPFGSLARSQRSPAILVWKVSMAVSRNLFLQCPSDKQCPHMSKERAPTPCPNSALWGEPTIWQQQPLRDFQQDMPSKNVRKYGYESKPWHPDGS